MSKAKPERISRQGLVRTFQHGSYLPSMSVRDNVLIGCLGGRRTGRVAASEQEQVIAQAIALFGLAGHENDIARNLPHGLQRLVSMAMAFAARPSLLCLDEPLTGLNQTEVAETLGVYRRLKSEYAMSILLVEHNMRAVMNICDRIYVLHHGEIIFSGTPDEVKASETVLKAYLGKRMASENTLTVRKLSVSYGTVPAIIDVDLEVKGGSIVSLIGANGAGKSTLIKAITGLVKVAGAIPLWRQAACQPRTQRHSRARRRAGARRPAPVRQHDGAREPRDGRLPDRRRAQEGRAAGDLPALFPRPRGQAAQPGERVVRRTAADGGRRPRADERAPLSAAGRAHDRPAPAFVNVISKVVRDINQQGVSVLLVEQNAEVALRVSDYSYVLESGTVVNTAPPRCSSTTRISRRRIWAFEAWRWLR